MGVAAQRHLELVSEEEILDGHVAARPQTGQEGPKKQQEQHPSG